MVRKGAILAMAIGVVAIIVGGVFTFEGVAKNNLVASSLRVEQITLGLSAEQISAGDVVDTAGEAQAAAERVKADRRQIAPTYSDLLAGGRYDPTNPTQLTYTQAMVLENSLYLAVAAFGLAQAVTAIGAVMVLIGVALGFIGLALRRLARGKS